MKYQAYPSFVDYLFSEDAKSLTYADLKSYLTTSGNYNSYRLPDDVTSMDLASVSANFIPSSKFEYPSARMDCRPYVSDSNGLYNETDKTYEEVFNIPAKDKISQSTYVDIFVKKAILDSLVRGEDEPDEESHSMGRRPEPSEYDTLRASVPFKKTFDEVEYDSWHVPMTFLNGDVPGVVAEDMTFSGTRLSVASGCLLAVQKDSKLYPIGFIDFENVMPCTRYDVKFDPQGFLQLQ